MATNEYHARKMREYRAANLEKFRARERRSKLWTKYGVTEEMWKAMFDKQQGRCAGCNLPFTDELKPCVDHCHVTMRFRGLLCHSCNRSIGLLKESVETLVRLVGYLSR